MRIAFFLSTLGGSPLQVGLERGMAQLGHHVEDYHHGRSYDLILIFNQTAHNTNYAYPDFPTGYPRIAFVDSAEYGYFRRLPGVVNSYWNAFAEGSLAHDTKNRHEQTRLHQFLEGRSFPYFLREFSKHISFPASYHPIDYPLYHHSVCPHPPNREEYLARPLDLFISWGASHPWRWDITKALRGCHTKCEILVLEENGTPRMPQQEFFRRTRSAKCSVSFDGYGSGSFRMMEVLVRCLLLQGPMSIHTRMPLVNGVTCAEYSVENDGEKFVSTDVCAKLRQCLEDPERSYRIYEAGYHWAMSHYTEKATAEYLLATVEKHDWSTPTTLCEDAAFRFFNTERLQ